MALEWVAAFIVMATRTPLVDAKPAAQRALHAACVDARAFEDRRTFEEKPAADRVGEGPGTAGGSEQQRPPPHSAPA
eukprot:6272849-Alexandrium_andersonii.AAC.1